jgi:hypothetical protein
MPASDPALTAASAERRKRACDQVSGGRRASVEACGHGLVSDDALSAEEAAEEYLLKG